MSILDDQFPDDFYKIFFSCSVVHNPETYTYCNAMRDTSKRVYLYIILSKLKDYPTPQQKT